MFSFLWFYSALLTTNYGFLIYNIYKLYCKELLRNNNIIAINYDTFLSNKVYNYCYDNNLLNNNIMINYDGTSNSIALLTILANIYNSDCIHIKYSNLLDNFDYNLFEKLMLNKNNLHNSDREECNNIVYSIFDAMTLDMKYNNIIQSYKNGNMINCNIDIYRPFNSINNNVILDFIENNNISVKNLPSNKYIPPHYYDNIIRHNNEFNYMQSYICNNISNIITPHVYEYGIIIYRTEDYSFNIIDILLDNITTNHNINKLNNIIKKQIYMTDKAIHYITIDNNWGLYANYDIIVFYKRNKLEELYNDIKERLKSLDYERCNDKKISVSMLENKDLHIDIDIDTNIPEDNMIKSLLSGKFEFDISMNNYELVYGNIPECIMNWV